MKYFNIKILILILFIVFTFTVQRVFAADVYLKANHEVGMGEQFYVDILLDTEGESFNGIEGSLIFSPDTAFLLRIEDGKSMFNTWIQKPVLESDKISFAGISTNGFSGVIDPFNPEVKLPGNVLRFIFEGIKPGNLELFTSKFILTKNDGAGTVVEIQPKNISINVGNYENIVVLTKKNVNDINPEIDAQIVKDKNLFDGKYALVFQAKDKGSGIKSVMIKEGIRNWKEINSPYLLEDQTRHSIINLRATNYSDVSIVTSIDALPYIKFTSSLVFIICLLLIILLFKVIKKYVHKKEIF